MQKLPLRHLSILLLATTLVAGFCFAITLIIAADSKAVHLTAHSLINFLGTAKIPVFISNLVLLVVLFTLSLAAFLKLQKRFETSERKYRHLVDYAPDGVIIHDGKKILFANLSAAKLIKAKNPEELIGREIADFLAPENKAEILENVAKMLTKNLTIPPHEENYICLDGSQITVEATAVSLTYDGKRALQVVGRDITKRRELENQLKKLAHFDELTGLPNRTLLFERLREIHAKAERYNHSYAILYLDLDGFKDINDNHGHATGDQLLREATQRMREQLRETDTLARIGGDEFVVVLPEITLAESAGQVAQKIIIAVRRPYFFKNATCDVSVSIGIAHFPHHGTELEELLKKSDAAMYRAKTSGKNSWEHYEQITHAAWEFRRIPAEIGNTFE